MSSIYDVIEALRKWKDYSLREVAQQAGITYTTLASIMSRRSSRVSKDILELVAAVFGVEWYKLLNCETADEVTLFKSPRFPDKPMVATELSEIDMKQALYEIIGNDFDQYLQIGLRTQTTSRSRVTEQGSQHNESLRLQFKQSIDFVLNKLNDDGLMEAMRRVLEVAQDPRYCAYNVGNNCDDKNEDQIMPKEG